MKLTHVCLVTARFDRMKEFYQDILQTAPKKYQGDYVEFVTEGAILSLYQLESMKKLAPGAIEEGANRSVLIEFQVPDADREYARLQGLKKWPIQFVLPPTTFPWGNRTIYFRDPDGNLLNFYSVVETK
ncbi:MAG: hypothetical protein FJ134_01905 [Deltaproteobacteria bacterium]|nr:hypothetical protein [Deltaproteobacteria bacterium]